VPGRGLAVLLVQPSPEVLDFQASLLAAITPFVEFKGTAAAFVRDPGEEISQSTMDWVEGFVPAQIGAGKYIAHITVGFATLDDLKTIEAEPFDAFPVHPASLAVYHLGNSGTARTQLKALQNDLLKKDPAENRGARIRTESGGFCGAQSPVVTGLR
jgi:hypothetical protein